MRAMPTGAPTRVPSCHSSFFFLDQGFFPQKVHPEQNSMNFNVSTYQLLASNLKGRDNAGLISPSCTASRTLTHTLNKRMVSWFLNIIFVRKLVNMGIIRSVVQCILHIIIV